MVGIIKSVTRTAILLLPEEVERFGAGAGAEGLEALLGEEAGERIQIAGLVIHEEDGRTVFKRREGLGHLDLTSTRIQNSALQTARFTSRRKLLKNWSISASTTASPSAALPARRRFLVSTYAGAGSPPAGGRDPGRGR